MLLILLSQIEVYFSRSVWNQARAYGDIPLDTVVVKYIDNAQKTIDMTIYSIWGSPAADSIVDALIDAKNRGVRVRIVAENYIANSYSASYDYITELINTGIPVLFDDRTDIGYYCTNTDGYLMHNKFIVIDSQMVITGSANWSNNGMRINANNIVIIFDSDVALAYLQEFEEMWGGNGDTPNWNNCKFQSHKTDNTTHVFYLNNGVVDSIKVFFSPTDGTENQIYRHISQSSMEIDIAINDFTLCSIRDSLKVKRSITHIVADSSTYYEDKPSINIRGLNVSSDTYCQNDPWNPPGDIYADNLNNPRGILHHKYAIFDRYVVLTGSVNWTYSGNNRNDENMILIYSDSVADVFLQEFVARYVEAGGDTANLLPVILEEERHVAFYPSLRIRLQGNVAVVDYVEPVRELELYSPEGRLIARQRGNRITLPRSGLFIIRALLDRGDVKGKVFLMR